MSDFGDRRDHGWIMIFMDPDPKSWDGQACEFLRSQFIGAARRVRRVSYTSLARELGIDRHRCKRILEALGMPAEELRNRYTVMQKSKRTKRP